MRGRQLDIKEPTQALEGETAEIFICRAGLFEDGLDELLGGTVHNPSLHLEVTLSGECAQDLGGPRKEFLGAMVREIRDRLTVAEDRRQYFGAGLVFGKNYQLHLSSHRLLIFFVLLAKMYLRKIYIQV